MIYIQKIPMYSGELCMRQDLLGGDWSGGLNARQLQVILEEKGSVCRIFSCLAVLVCLSLCSFLHQLNHKLWLPASQLTDCSSQRCDAAGSGREFEVHFGTRQKIQ